MPWLKSVKQLGQKVSLDCYLSQGNVLAKHYILISHLFSAAPRGYMPA